MNIEALVEERVKNIRKRHPDMSIDYIIQEGEYGQWGVVLYTEYDFSVIGFEFIESETSWKRPEAIEEFNNLIEEGHCVVILAPSNVKNDISMMLKEKGGRSNIRLYSLEKATIP